MRGRCDRHELALSPNGSCVLCRREANAGTAPAAADAALGSAPMVVPATARETPAAIDARSSIPNRDLNVSIHPALLLLPLGALAIYWAKSETLSLEQSRAEAASALAVQADTATDAPPPRSHDTPARRAEAGSATTSARPEASSLLETGTNHTATPTVSDRADAARERQLAKQRQAEELAAARERVNVTVYYAEWCPACRSTRAYMRERGIRSVEHDIDKDSRARSRQRLLNPRGSIPTIDIEGQVLVGFDASEIERTISRAAQARLERDR